MPYVKTPWVANVTPVTAASMNNIEAGIANAPGTEIGYDQITANVAVAVSAADNGTTVIACAPHTFDGAPVVAEFFAPNVDTAAQVAAFIAIALYEGATEIGRICFIRSPAAAVAACSLTGKLRFTPSAGAHTYTVTAGTLGGPAGTIESGPGGLNAFVPAYIQFTKV